MGGWMGGWVDGRMGGWMDGRMGGWMDAHAFIDKYTGHTLQENQAEPRLDTNCKPSCGPGERQGPPSLLAERRCEPGAMPSLPRGFSRHGQAPATNPPHLVASSLGHLPASSPRGATGSVVFFGGMCLPRSPVGGRERRKEPLGKSWRGGGFAGRVEGRGFRTGS